MSVLWLCFKIPLSITRSIESSRRDLLIDLVVKTFNNNYFTLFPCFTLITKVWNYYKQGLVFTV